MKTSPFSVSVSIMDFPLFRGLDYLFAGLKNTGVDGLEIVLGVKTRFNFSQLAKLSDKYELPIVSFHQPPWSGLGWYLDESFIREGKGIGVTHYTFHPLPRFSFDSEQMKLYLTWIARMQHKYHITAHLENMPKEVRPGLLSKLIPLDNQTTDLLHVQKITKEYGLSMTFDTSHAYNKQPQEESWFAQILPSIGNIHLSSFTSSVDHLPLYLGDFDSQGFLSSLKKKNYSGLLTFEIFYPKLPIRDYNFEAIRKSVDIVKSIR